MKVLITGAKGFIGTNLTVFLKRKGYDVFSIDIDNSEQELVNYINECDFIVHLAGINRPLTTQEFYDGNTNFTKKLVDLVKKSGRKLPVIMSSSIQAELDNDYGKSKKQAEDYLFSSGLPVYVYRLANVFGKGCRPNYNSAAATFCYNIAHDLDIMVRDENYVVKYNYIDDICLEFFNVLKGNRSGNKEVLYVNPTHPCSLGKLANLLKYFKKEVESDRHLPLIHDEFEFKLFKAFLSYLRDDSYNYNYAEDNRGYFEELYKDDRYGQISDNMAYPGITKGGHYHTYKKEIFYVVVGKCEIVQRNIETDDMIINSVESSDLHPINIIPKYTHEITNIGDVNSHTLMWISEIYDDKRADTYREEVRK